MTIPVFYVPFSVVNLFPIYSFAWHTDLFNTLTSKQRFPPSIFETFRQHLSQASTSLLASTTRLTAVLRQTALHTHLGSGAGTFVVFIRICHTTRRRSDCQAPVRTVPNSQDSDPR